MKGEKRLNKNSGCLLQTIGHPLSLFVLKFDMIKIVGNGTHTFFPVKNMMCRLALGSDTLHKTVALM